MKDIEQRAKMIASETKGLFGPVPLERVVRKHVAFFMELRDAGASWRQIAALMTKAGIYRKDDQPIGHDQWRSMVARAKRMAGEAPKVTGRTVAHSNLPRTDPVSDRSEKSPAALNSESKHSDQRYRKGIRERMKNARSARDD